MRIDGRRRSENFEDRGTGSGRSAGGRGGIPVQALVGIARRLGVRGTLIVGAIGVGIFFFAPPEVRSSILGLLTGGGPGPSATTPGTSACAISPAHTQACDFSRVVLASTEDVWATQFSGGRLPSYGRAGGAYRNPTLVVFSTRVETGGCGSATDAVGPFYCPADDKLYIDPTFYETMARRLRAPGDFAQAYVIAHEVGHHVQNLVGSPREPRGGETRNQNSVRMELQADCFAGVWGHAARASLAIDDADLGEAITAAHAIGDDTLGHRDERQFTHGSSEQRIRWFRRGFETGDPRLCDTFAVPRYDQL